MSRLRAAVAIAGLALATVVAPSTDAGATISNADHADDVCAPTADPCIVSETVEIANGATLDFGGRTLQIQGGGSFDVGIGSGVIRCGHLTATVSGTAFNLRGPSPFGGSEGGLMVIDVRRRCSGNTSLLCFVDSTCALAGAGTCTAGTGDATLQGKVSGSADEPGTFVLRAAGDVFVRQTIQMIGQTTESDGGSIEIESTKGSIFVDSSITASGGGLSSGGEICLIAKLDLRITASTSVDGGDFDGGYFECEAGRDLVLTNGVSANSTSGGGYGGEILMVADRDLTVIGGGSSNRLQLATNGHTSFDNFSGDGGVQEYEAGRNLRFGEFVRATSIGSQPDGFGDTVALTAGSELLLEGDIDARSSGTSGGGGYIELLSFGTLEVTPAVKLDVTGGSFGSGEVAIDATGQMFYDGVIDASSGSSGLAGTVDLNSDAEMFLTGDVTVSGAHVNTVVGRIDVRGCRVEFLNGASFNNAASNGINRLVARERISVAVGAAVLAPTSGGQNRITYRTPAKPPQISGVVSPSPTLVVDKNLPGCPVCGNNELDGGETCEDGNINPGDGCSADCQDEGCIADTPGYPSVVLCDDQDACTVDSCNTTQHACEHVSSCDDGIACTVDSCAGNECVHTPNDALCDAGSPCADDFCNETNGCLFAPRSGPCDDALFCNGADTCANGSCSEHTGDPCVGGAECRDTCDESSDTCIAPGGSPCSEDGNECTSDFCNGSGLCIHPANNAACSDGVFCNGLDFCQSGACTVHSGNPCTEQGECRDVCDEAAGACQAVAGNECSDDGNICTEDVCDGSGGCSHIESATFDQGRAIVTRRSGPGNDRLLIAGAFPLADLTAEPSDTGVLVDIRDENGDAVYDAILPSSAIQNVKGASKVFKFKDRTGEHPDTNGIAVAIFKRDTKRAIVKFKIRGRGYEIPQIVGKPHVSMAMLFGEDPGIGDCISGASLPCGARGSKVLCGD